MKTDSPYLYIISTMLWWRQLPTFIYLLSYCNNAILFFLCILSKYLLYIRVSNFQTLVWDLRLLVIPQILLLLFLYMLKTKTFLHILSQNHQQSEFNNFDFIFAKKICDFRQKREKRPHQAGFSCAWAGLWPAVTRTLNTLRSFQTFLIHKCWQLCFVQIVLAS